jgi:hypothetical protein
LDGLVRGRRELDQLEAPWLFMAGEYARSGDWQADGFLSAAAAIQQRCNMNADTARRAVHLAKRLERLPATQKAFDAGEISRAHAAVIASAYTEERAPKLAEIEESLAEFAHQVDPKSLRAAVQRYTDAIDGDGGAGSDEKQYEKNRFHASPVGDRVSAGASLDVESGEIVMTAVAAMTAQLRENGDKRRKSQRDAEALVEICRRSLAQDHQTPTTRRRGRPQLSVVGDLAAFEATHPELVGDIRIEAAHVGYLSRTTLERLSCDCEITRVITDGDSAITDVGRATRNISDALWNALVVRDRHCQEPGCRQPPGVCEAHHIWHWEHGGPTNLDNLKLLCWAHHRKHHLEHTKQRR